MTQWYIKRRKIVHYFFQNYSVYCDVRPKLFNVLSTVSWSGALRTCTRGGGMGIAGNTLVNTVV